MADLQRAELEAMRMRGIEGEKQQRQGEQGESEALGGVAEAVEKGGHVQFPWNGAGRRPSE
ncbi:hypothetical protein GCM10017653_48270 [Ancylobacter defluvii]|uniref:Uncharacterized protein n=1 Tax=Ancylobacter defluvii TaxID=1282440 RepID=A0A9W6NDL0_9HYPH|nr:hypothetical protein GCM10017653_48270 [Ancylobacter defluvii]